MQHRIFLSKIRTPSVIWPGVACSLGMVALAICSCVKQGFSLQCSLQAAKSLGRPSTARQNSAESLPIQAAQSRSRSSRVIPGFIKYAPVGALYFGRRPAPSSRGGKKHPEIAKELTASTATQSRRIVHLLLSCDFRELFRHNPNRIPHRRRHSQGCGKGRGNRNSYCGPGINHSSLGI